MKYSVPSATLNTQQRMVADLLALGLSAEKAASASGVAVSTIRVWMKGSLFNLQVDNARERTIEKRRQAFNNKLAEELDKNLEFLSSIRDDINLKIADRLRAVEDMLHYIAVPAGRKQPEGDGTLKASITFNAEKTAHVQSVLSEVVDGEAVEVHEPKRISHKPSRD